jgi:HEPN domain-containing protein
VIPFTNREIERAWRNNKAASEQAPRTNGHRLLLFYAVECGLKAILMRRQRKTRTDECPVLAQCQHDINKLLDSLSAGQSLKLPSQLSMAKIKSRNGYDERKFTSGEINQMWRYGGCCTSNSTTDTELENQLLKIVRWIEGELRTP